MVENLLNYSIHHLTTDHDLKQYNFANQHRPRLQHRNADELSKRTNDYKKHEHQPGELPLVAEKWNFLSQEGYDKLRLKGCADKLSQAAIKVAHVRNRVLGLVFRE